MRDSQTLLIDLLDRPEWVHRQLDRITDLYFHYYDRLYEQSKDEVGGSVFWAWAPGRMAKLQCDFSAMIGPAARDSFTASQLRGGGIAHISARTDRETLSHQVQSSSANVGQTSGEPPHVTEALRTLRVSAC